MVVSLQILFIFLAVLIVCLLGFKKYIWFISLGYGFSIATIGIMLLILFKDKLDIYLTLSCIIIICYGLRLGAFLAYRELKSSTYNRKIKNEISDGNKATMPLKIVVWLSCGLLYLLMTSPIIYRFINGNSGDTCFLIGMIIAILGISLEAISDFQKSSLKKKSK